MQRNYIGPNLMNQVNVSPAPLTSLARDLPSLPAGQTEAFTLSTSQSHSCRVGKKKKKENLKHAPVITANQECTDL